MLRQTLNDKELEQPFTRLLMCALAMFIPPFSTRLMHVGVGGGRHGVRQVHPSAAVFAPGRWLRPRGVHPAPPRRLRRARQGRSRCFFIKALAIARHTQPHSHTRARTTGIQVAVIRDRLPPSSLIPLNLLPPRALPPHLACQYRPTWLPLTCFAFFFLQRVAFEALGCWGPNGVGFQIRFQQSAALGPRSSHGGGGGQRSRPRLVFITEGLLLRQVCPLSRISSFLVFDVLLTFLRLPPLYLHAPVFVLLHGLGRASRPTTCHAVPPPPFFPCVAGGVDVIPSSTGAGGPALA